MIDAARLFHLLYGPSLPEALAIHVRIVANTKTDASVNKSYTRLRWYTFDTLPDTWPTDANVWFGVGLRPFTTESAGEKAPILWTTLWADLDDRIVDDLHLPDAFPLPSAIVNSGHGLHVYWLLRQPITDAATMKAYLKLVQRRVGADSAATDPERVLRVPGTVNVKHADAPACTLLDLHPERVYDLEQFGTPETRLLTSPAEQDEIQPVPLDYADAVFPPGTEWLKTMAALGFDKAKAMSYDERVTSQSGFLFHLATALHKGGQTKAQIKGFMLGITRCLEAKDRARPKTKIDGAIHEAVRIVTQRAAEVESGMYPDADGNLCVTDAKGKPVPVTNFLIQAHEVYDDYGEMGGYLVSIRNKRKQEIRKVYEKDVFTNLAKWRQKAPLSFMIHEPRYFPHLQIYLNAQEPKPRQLVEMLGWYRGRLGAWDYLVTSEETLGQTGIIDETPYRFSGNYRWPLLPHPRWRTEAADVLARLLQIQEPHVVWALLGWMMSTFIAPQLREVRGGWEHGEWFGLWMWGMQGSGKTTATVPFLRITGLPSRFFNVHGDDSSKVGLQRLLASSNTSPVWVDDPRKKGLDKDTLFSVMRGVLNAATVTIAADKGNKTAVRDLRAPLLVCSEHAIEDGAMRARYLHVPWHKPWKDENPQTKAIIRGLVAQPLEMLARGFFQFFWEMNVEASWQQMLTATTFLRADDRPQHAIAQVLLGLDMAQMVAPDLRLGADWRTIAEELYLRSTEDTGLKPDQQKVAVLKEVYDLAWNFAERKGDNALREGEDWRLDGDAVYVRFSRFHYLLRNDTSGMRVSTVRQAVAQSPTYAEFRDVKFRGGQLAECLAFNLNTIVKAKWDNPWSGLNMGGF